VKWSERPVGTDVLRNLREKGNMPRWDGFEKKNYVIFSRSGFIEALIEQAKSDGSLILAHGNKRVV